MIKGMRYGSIYGISYLDKKNVLIALAKKRDGWFMSGRKIRWYIITYQLKRRLQYKLRMKDLELNVKNRFL